jgi:hypothetical protein
MQVTCNFSAQGRLFPLRDIFSLIDSKTNTTDDNEDRGAHEE